ncbi:MAG: adenylyltransferase/cytidyltransferase family protein [Thermosulfidibacteraceae bacterium]|jgi:rfaE bifunctional protein nucleotidyltransferase chain/domain
MIFSREKIKTFEEIKNIVRNLKEEGKVIVIANGCFDILHVGHIRYLEEAKTYGDILIVAINSDRSVKMLKGPSRPVMNEKERAEIVAAIGCVDYVFIFDELRLDKILLELKPHYQAKGKDYTAETVPERETVESYGGKVIICGDPKEHNSSEIIKRMKNNL